VYFNKYKILYQKFVQNSKVFKIKSHYVQIMIKIDKKDRKILYQLDVDSRQSLSAIGKKVGLPKNVVAYRINRLKELGIINNFYTIIDASKLGYTSLRIYLTYQYTTPEIEQKILDYFIKNRYTWWIGSIEGRFDIGIIMWVKDINEFYSFWEEILKRYRYYFEQQIVGIYLQALHYRYSYLLDEKVDRSKIEVAGGGKKVEGVDDLDFKILQQIAPNARIPITEIAKNLKTTATVVKYRIKKLKELKIIQGYRTNIDFSKLGYQYFKVDIDLKDYNRIEQITNYVKSNPHLIYINKSAGYADLEVEFHVKNLADIHHIMKDIITKFPDSVKNYKFFNYTDINKMQYMP